jgi:hypothetical protein
VDRRPQASGKSEPEPSSASRPAKAVQIASVASAEPARAPKALALATSFALSPLLPGSRIVLKTKYTVRATLVTAEEGGSRQSVEADSEERIAVTVARANPDGAREIEVEYLESSGRFRLDGSPDEEESNAGKRYLVVFEGSEPRVTAKSGKLEPEEDRGVLLDLGTVTGYFPLLKPHLPRSLEPGFRLRLASEDLTRMFGAPAGVEFDGSELSLKGRLPADPNVAIFECKLPVGFVKDGVALRAALGGTVSVRTTDTRPLEVSLRGRITSAAAELGSGTSLDGSVAIELSHSYESPK